LHLCATDSQYFIIINIKLSAFKFFLKISALTFVLVAGYFQAERKNSSAKQGEVDLILTKDYSEIIPEKVAPINTFYI